MGVTPVVVGLAILALVVLWDRTWVVTDGERIAIGLGGTSLAALIVGTVWFDSIRAAASLPVVVLIIGMATWPGADSEIEPDLRAEVIKWMGVLLAANAGAEALAQSAEAFTRGNSRSSKRVREDDTSSESEGDLV